MHINEGDGFVLTNGRRVRIGSIYDVYDSYDIDEQVGHDPETRIRYSHWWQDGRLIAARDEPLTSLIEEIVEHVPPHELPESQKPSVRRGESHW